MAMHSRCPEIARPSAAGGDLPGGDVSKIPNRRPRKVAQMVPNVRRVSGQCDAMAETSPRPWSAIRKANVIRRPFLP